MLFYIIFSYICIDLGPNIRQIGHICWLNVPSLMFIFSVQEIWTRIISAKPGSEKIALNSFVYIAYNLLMLLTKGSDLSFVLSLVKLMHCLNTILCRPIFHWHTEQNDTLSIKIFINLFFTTWQVIPFKGKFYISLMYLRAPLQRYDVLDTYNEAY